MLPLQFNLQLISLSLPNMTTIKPKSPARFKLGRQSSLAPDSRTPTDALTEDEDEEFAAAAAAGIVDPTIRLMYLANEGDIEGINKMLDSGTNVDYRDIDGRTALHVAACQGRTDVVELLLSRGAKVNSMDRWGSTVRIRTLRFGFDFDFSLTHIAQYVFDELPHK